MSVHFLRFVTAVICFAIFVFDGFAFIIEELPNTSVSLGDGPHWRYPNLYYADLGSGQVVRYNTLTNKAYKCQINNQTRVSFIIPYRNSKNLFAVGLGHVAAQLFWDGVSSRDCKIGRKLFEVETENPRDVHNCLNDGKCDARGRLYTGTANCALDPNTQRNLYKYDRGHLELVHSHVNMSNGLAWNYKRREFYHVDSPANTITRFKYDGKTGAITNPEIVFKLDTSQFPSNNIGWVILDGMTIDYEGNLFATVFGGGSVLKICTKTWIVLKRFKLPCTFVTSAVFGGAHFDTLYVTSAANLADLGQFPKPCGTTFRLIGTSERGLPMDEMK